MPSKIYLSKNGLQLILEAFLNSISSYSPVFSYYFKDLYNTGLRCEELKNFDLWYFDNSGNICINTLKGGAPRIAVQNDLTAYTITNFTNGVHCYEHLAQSTLCYWLNTFMVPNHIFHDSKSIKTHLFRHYKAKELYDLGMSYADIQTYFGEKDLGNMKNYINSDLWYWH